MRENSGRDGGIEELYWGPSGKRRQEVGWGKDAPYLRVRRAKRYEENLHAAAEERRRRRTQ